MPEADAGSPSKRGRFPIWSAATALVSLLDYHTAGLGQSEAAMVWFVEKG